MKLRYIYRSLLFVIGVFFILLGFVGLLLPVVPQVPFFIIGAICLMESSNRIKEWVKGHELYQKHCQKIIEKSHFLKKRSNSFHFGIVIFSLKVFKTVTSSNF